MIQVLLSAVLYRIGGMDKKLIPFANTKFRDFGVPVIMAWTLFQHNVPWNIVLISCIALFGALTTYWDVVFGEDNLYAHGFICGIAMLPLLYDGAHWYMIIAYSICISLVMGGLNTLCTKVSIPFSDWIEELSRGAIIQVASVLLFMK